MDKIVLSNDDGIVATILPFGGAIQSILVKDKNGKSQNVVLGYPSEEGYLSDNANFGVICGRYANRIAKGKFELNGTNYQLPINNIGNHLHGGPNGFGRRYFTVVNQTKSSVTLFIESSDGEEGYPGKVELTVTYEINGKNSLDIIYSATSTMPTPVNFTNHSYFNLNGEGSGTILDHFLKINGSKYIEILPDLIPTGEVLPVANTPLDFRIPCKIGSRINEPFSALINGNGYDLSYEIDKETTPKDEPVLCAEVWSIESGIKLACFTTEPAVQLYTGNFLDGTNCGTSGKEYQKNSGFCLETQHFPDSPNHKNFPSTILEPGTVYKQYTRYSFSNYN